MSDGMEPCRKGRKRRGDGVRNEIHSWQLWQKVGRKEKASGSNTGQVPHVSLKKHTCTANNVIIT